MPGFPAGDKERGVYPVFLDIDLDYMGKCTLDEDLQREKHISTANFIVDAMRKQFPQLGDVEILMSKRQAYFKGKKKVRVKKKWVEEEVTRDGFHLWAPSVKISLPQLQKLRQVLLKHEGINFDEHYGCEGAELGYWVDRSEIFDKALFNRSNGLVVMGQKKPKVGTAHEIFFWSTFKKDVQNPDKTITLTEEQRVQAYRKCYSFLFQKATKIPPKAKPTPKPKPKPAPKAVCRVEKTCRNAGGGKFNLDAFLSAVPHVNNSSYKTAVSYFSGLGMDPEQTCNACNAAWNPKDKRETARMMKNMQAKGDFRTYKKDFVRMMVENGAGDAVNKVFPSKLEMLDGHEAFVGEQVKESAVRDWFIRKVKRIGYGEKRFFTFLVKSGHDVEREATKQCPFSGKNGFKYFIEEENKEGELVSKAKNSAKLVQDIIAMNQFEHFNRVDFLPFGPDEDDDTPKGVLNEWLGYPMARYRPVKKHKRQGDMVDVYLTEVYGEEQKTFLLDLWAFYVQFPGERTGRFCVVKGEEGSGKTFLFYVMECFLSKMYCHKTNDVKAYIGKFNNLFKFNKVIMIDDINGLTYKVIRQLMPKATSEKEEYEPKGLPRQQCTEVAELWFTGNQDSPLNTHAKSRRDLILESKPAWVGQTKRFAKLRKFLRNRGVGKAWFEFLRIRDVTKFDPRCAHTDVRQEVNIDSMSPVLSFLLDFFTSDDWMDKHPKFFDKDSQANRIENYKQFGFDENCSVWVTHRLFGHWIKCHMKENYPDRRALSKASIVKQMKAIGIGVTRGVHTTDRREVWGLVAQTVADHAMLLYQVQMDPWVCDTNREVVVAQHKSWVSLS